MKPLPWTLCSKCQIDGEHFLSFFVACLENMNFKKRIKKRLFVNAKNEFGHFQIKEKWNEFIAL